MALIAHLDANCGGLHSVDLINLPSEMIGYYVTAKGIPEYINALEDAQRKLARAKLPMADVQLLPMASTAILASNHSPQLLPLEASTSGQLEQILTITSERISKPGKLTVNTYLSMLMMCW